MKKTNLTFLTLLFSIVFIGYSMGQSITITSPSDGATVGTSFNVTADAVGTYTKVRIKLDGVTQTSLDDTSAPYSFALTDVSEGSHEIKVYGKDTPSGTWHNQVINVTVSESAGGGHATAVTSTASVDGTTVNMTAEVNGTITGGVRFRLDGDLQGSDMSDPYSFEMTNVAAGDHVVNVYTRSTNDTWVNGPDHNISIQGASTAGVTITSPTDGATLGSDFTVTADAVGTYVKLRIKVDGALISELDDTSAPYSFALTGIADGSHAIKVYGKNTDDDKWYNQTINVTVDGGNPGPGPGPGTGTIRVGSPGVTFGSGGNSQTPEWIKAGVEGGIPFLNGSPVIQTLSATNTAGIQAAIDAAESAGGGQVVLNNGTYTIDATLNMKSNVRLVGESKDGAILNITMTGSTGSAIVFGTPGQAGTTVYAGMDNLTIQGGHGQPNDFTMTDAKSNFLIHSVYFSGGSKNCWLDNVNIINSGNGAITTWQCSNITIRDCYIERSWNKGAGGHGYVQLSGSYILFFNNTVKKMRHLAIQREGAHHNVVYRNNLEQDVNFHNADAGDNLVEKNVVRLPAGLDSQYHAMMGPWSTQHSAPGPNNVVYGNDCIENNNGGITTFCDPGKVYVPVRFEGDNPFDENTNVPIGGTFYPVNNVPADDGATPSGNCSASNETCEPDSGPGNIFNDDFNCPNWAANYDLTPPEDPSVNGNDVTHMPTGGYNNTPGIRVKISAGSHYGCDFRYRTDVSEAYAQYKVLYEPGFGGQGIGLEGSGGYWGKSPGWDGTRRSCGWGNCVPTTSKPGWSARGSLDRVNGKVKNKAYLYYMDMTPGQDYGDSWYWEGPAMNTNQWYTIDQHIKVNTPGTSNGELRIWQDGTLVFQQTGINFTEVGGDFAKIEGFWFNYYYGGKPVADEDTYVRLDDFRLSTSPIGPSASGSNCIGSQCAVATLSSPSNGANLTFPFNVTGNINVSGYRMSVVMDHKDYPEDDEARPIWVGGTTGTTNSGTFQCTSKPNVKTGATRLIFYGVDDDGNGDGFAYFTEEVVIDVNLSGSSSRTTSENEEAKIIDTEKNVSVYPNPTNRTVNLKLGSDHKYHSLHIVDLSGKTVVTKPVRSTDFRIEIDLDKLSIPKGIYTIRLISPDNIDTQRLIKN